MANPIRDKIIREKLIPYQCANCGCDGNWNGKQLTLQLHHKDGNHYNDDLGNLEFLCPNCHATTESYCRNKQTSIDENKVLELIAQGYNIRQILLTMGLSDGSANYTKIYKILKENNIEYTNFSHNQHRIASPKLENYCIDCGKVIGTKATRCQVCEHKYRKETGNHINYIVENRPSREELLKDIATSSFCAVGRKYGVSDNAIRKWCAAYGLPTRIKEIKDLYVLIG